jgi:hypothetical protein
VVAGKPRGLQEDMGPEQRGTPDLLECSRAPVRTRLPSGERTPMPATPTLTTLVPGYMFSPTSSSSSPALNTSCNAFPFCQAPALVVLHDMNARIGEAMLVQPVMGYSSWQAIRLRVRDRFSLRQFLLVLEIF